MGKKLLPALMLVVAFSTACPSGVDPINPYDPDTPISDKAKASLSGKVLLEGNGDVTQVEILVAGLTGHPEQDGTFLIEGIPPTIQEVLFRLEGYEDVRQSRLFSPGSTEEMEVRIQVMRGAVTGSVLLQEQNDHSGVTVVLVPANDTEGSFQMAALTATEGNYVFDSVPVGTYRLSASKPHYMGKVVNDVQVDPYSISQVPQLELPPVTGAVEILGGDPDQQDPFVNPDYPACCPNDRFTRTSQVLLHTEGFNAVRMKVSEDQSSLQGPEGWETYETEQTFELSELNGAKTVYVLLEDNNGVRSDVLEGHTILDTQAPEVIDLVLGDGSGYTAESAISVSAFGDDLPMESGLAEMRMEVGSAPAQDAVWQPYLLRAPFVLPQQDGEHQVFVELRDRAGNRATVVSGTIRLDRQPPHPAQGMQPVVVHNGSGYALGMDVPIYFNVTDDVSPTEDMKMAICETEGCDGVAFSPYSSQTIMSFSSEGTHTVYAVFKDGAGNVYAPEGVSFEIDTTAPTFPVVSVEEGPSVSSPDIHLLIDLSGADQVLVSENAEVPALDDGRWSDFQNRLAYNIGQAEGEHMIFVYAKDMAGHMSGPAMVRVELDTTPPDGTLHIVTKQSNCNGTQCYTNSESVLVEVGITSADDTSSIQMQLSLDDTFDEALQAYSPVATVLLAGDQSIFQEIHAQLIDQAGNTTQIVSDNKIRLDLDPPSLPLISTTPLGYTSNNEGIVLSIDTESQDDVSGVEHYEYLADPPLLDGVDSWRVFTGSSETLEAADNCASCSYTFMVRAVDFAGNIGDPASVRLIVDETDPQAPNASVLPSEINKGPRVINADAVSVFVQTDDSSDENFDQFQVRIRTCSGGFDPGTSACANGWNSWSAWRDTGVGKGGREILVVLAGQDTANQIEVRGRDLTGATSPADSVIFTEDSRPPSPAVMYPDTAVVNADTAVLYLSQPAWDENSIDSYECTINGKFDCLTWDGSSWSNNGGQSNHMDPSIREIKVNLDQDSENVIRLRAIDKAGNYSGTFESIVTEKSTIYDESKEITAQSANSFVNESYKFTVTDPDSMDMDGGLMASTFFGKMDDNSDISGLLIHDFNSNANIVYNSRTLDVHIEHQRILALVSLFNLFNDDFGPSYYMFDHTNNPELVYLKDCVTGNNDCSSYDGTRVGELLADWLDDLMVPIIIDMSTGEPIIKMIYLSKNTRLGLRTPLILPDWNSGNKISFDGMHVAWIEPPGFVADNDLQCTINVATIDNDPNGSYLCNPAEEFCTFNNEEMKIRSNVSKCGRLAVTDTVAAWTEIDDNQDSSVMMYDYTNGNSWEIEAGGSSFDPDLKEPMVADCRWDDVNRTPLCRHLFWVSNSSLAPVVKVLDLANPGALLIDEIKRGIVEIRSMSAEDGRVAWRDMIEGTADIFYMDLDDPNQCDPTPGSRNCIGHEKVIVRSNDEETMLAMSGKLVPYWRLAGDGLQLHASETASKAWSFARPAMHADAIMDNDIMALSSINASDSNFPYKVGAFNTSTHDLSWYSKGSTMRLPISTRDLGSDAALSFMSIDETDGTFIFYYCESETDCLSSPTHLLHSVNYSEDYAVGDENRVLWVEHEKTDQNHLAIMDCDMDPSSAHSCSSGQFRQLFDISSSATGTVEPRVCSMAIDDDIGILALVDNYNQEGSVYRLDMSGLDSRPSPISTDDINSIQSSEPGIHSALIGGPTHSQIVYRKCSDFIDNRLAVDASSTSFTMALAFTSMACGSCKNDNPNTPYNENCSTPPCCGDESCQCNIPSDCENRETITRIGIYDDQDKFMTYFSYINDEDSISLKLKNGFVAWKTREDNRWIVFVRDLLSSSIWKISKDNKDVQFPSLYQKNGATHLMWTDASLGPMQIFSTVLSR